MLTQVQIEDFLTSAQRCQYQEDSAGYSTIVDMLRNEGVLVKPGKTPNALQWAYGTKPKQLRTVEFVEIDTANGTIAQIYRAENKPAETAEYKTALALMERKSEAATNDDWGTVDQLRDEITLMGYRVGLLPNGGTVLIDV